MKNFLIAFILFFLWSVLGIWFYTCKIKHLCNETIADPITEPIESEYKESEPKPIVIENSIDSLIIYSAASDTITYPSKIDSINQSFFNYLNQNQGKELVITGLYNNQETEDFGIERAEVFKRQLVDFGINADKITTGSKHIGFDFNDSGAYSGGITYDYQNVSEDRRAEIEKGVTNKILYASFASKEFQPDKTLQAYALELKTYLEKYPDKKVTIIGHTDAIGKAEANQWIGQQRANNVRQYLISQGISKNRISASSQGENNPIADNSSEEGRQKNRRIEITIN